MPEELVLVYEKESGTPLYMHSIDAKEAVQLGDYTVEAPSGKELTSEEKMAAAAPTRGMAGSVPPEMQTPEQRAATRAAANEASAQTLTALPLGTPVLVQPHTTTAATPATTEPSGSRSSRRGD